jgi:hypothetical protein
MYEPSTQLTPEIADVVPTSRGIELLTAVNPVIDKTVSLVLSMLFTTTSRRELRQTRMLFAPSANIVFIPRQQPTSARAIDVDAFCANSTSWRLPCTSWHECHRFGEPTAISERLVRVRSRVDLSDDLAGGVHTVDAIVVLRRTSSEHRVQSCTIVYDA